MVNNETDRAIKIIELEKELEKTQTHINYIQKELGELKDLTKTEDVKIHAKLEYIEREMPNKTTYNLIIAIVTAVIGFGFSIAMLFLR